MFFNKYFEYVGESEVPMVFHRWSAISLIGALLARKVYFKHGRMIVYPNQYIVLVGSPGARKGTAIKTAKTFLDHLHYKHISPNKAAKEALWEWMAKQSFNANETDDAWIDEVIVDDNDNSSFISQCYIAHDEFLDFVGIGDDGLITNITNLWDNLRSYSHPKTRGREITVPNPTINILSGMTQSGIAHGLKKIAYTGGFTSRVLFIYSEPSKTRIAFPPKNDEKLELEIATHLTEVEKLEGAVTIAPDVKSFLTDIYHNTPAMKDERFAGYMQRRFQHLLKLITIFAAADLTLRPTLEHCLLANTVLTEAESRMPSALGEFGESKNASLANKIVNMIEISPAPVTLGAISAAVYRDIDKPQVIHEILNTLLGAERLQKTTVKGMSAFIPNHAGKRAWKSKFLDYTLLHPDEHYEDVHTTQEILHVNQS